MSILLLAPSAFGNYVCPVDAGQSCAKHRTLCRNAEKYLPQSTRVLSAEYSDGLRKKFIRLLQERLSEIGLPFCPSEDMYKKVLDKSTVSR